MGLSRVLSKATLTFSFSEDVTVASCRWCIKIGEEFPPWKFQSCLQEGVCVWIRVWVSCIHSRQGCSARKKPETRSPFLSCWVENQGHSWNLNFWGSFLQPAYPMPVFCLHQQDQSKLFYWTNQQRPGMHWISTWPPRNSLLSTQITLEVSKIARKSVVSETIICALILNPSLLMPWTLPSFKLSVNSFWHKSSGIIELLRCNNRNWFLLLLTVHADVKNTLFC